MRRPSVGPALLLALACLLVIALSGCDDRGGKVDVSRLPDNRDRPVWVREPSMPLSPRTGPVVAWTGEKILVVGGDVGDPCPPNADCAVAAEAARDGAAFDPTTGGWTPIASAPVPLPANVGSAFAGGHLFIRLNGRVLDYDATADRWRTLDRPVSDWHYTVADGRRLLLVAGSDEGPRLKDLVYDVPTGRWSALPPDPIGPSFDRGITPTPAGLVLTAQELVPSPGSDEPSLVLAARLDRKTQTWTRLPDTDQLGGNWAWAGERMVSVGLGTSDGGEVGNYGRDVPTGGRIDPVTGAWSPLRPEIPAEDYRGWPVYAAGPRLVASSGWIYDDAEGHVTWTRVKVPQGAQDNPGPAVWVGDTVYVFGSTPQAPISAEDYDNKVWSWAPSTGALQ